MKVKITLFILLLVAMNSSLYSSDHPVETYSTYNSFYSNIQSLRTDPLPGSISLWGLLDHGLEEIPEGDDFTAVAAGDYHALALRTDGTLVAWGAGTTNTGTFPHYGQSIVPAGNDFVAIAAGALHSMALRSDGTLVAWGRNLYGQTNVPAGNDFVAIACGGMHSLALREDGTLEAWGAGTTDTGVFPHFGQSIVPAGEDFVMISGGAAHSLALKSDGSLLAWGRNNYGQTSVPGGYDFIVVSANNYHNLALKEDGSIAAWGRNTSGQCNIPVGQSFVSISAGRENSLGITSEGSLLGWGMNTAGQSDVPDGYHYSAVAAGYQFGIAIHHLQYELLSPNGGEIWQAGTERLIRWLFKGEPVPLHLRFSSDDGINWIDITTINSTDGSFNWLVPSVISPTCRIQAVFYYNEIEHVMESADNFTITQSPVAEITVLSPTAPGIRWQTGKVYELIWESTDVSQVDICYSIDNGYTWTVIAESIPADLGSYNWLVPETPSQQGRIRIRDTDNQLVEHTSIEPFTIIGLVFLTTFDGLELFGGENLLIEFAAFYAYRFKMLLSLDSGMEWQIIESDFAQTSYNWLVPNHSSDQVILRLEDYYDSDINIESEIFGLISPITLISPIGGENLLVGILYNIEWTATDEVSSVLIDYSIDGGANWLPVRSIPYPADAGFYEWLIPNTMSAECLVKVKNVVNHNTFGISENLFTISDRYIEVLQPAGGEEWLPGSQQLILWNSENIETVNILYSYDGGSNWLLIAESVDAGSSPYVWEIPYIGTTAGKIKVSDSDNSMIHGLSEGLFTILHHNSPRNLSAEIVDGTVVLTWEAPYGAERELFRTARIEEQTDRRSIRSLSQKASYPRSHQTRRVSEPGRRELLGYNVYRDEILINQELLSDTNYQDTDVLIGSTYTYFVTAVYDDAESDPSNIIEVLVTGLEEEVSPALLTALHPNHPNPFNPLTRIRFTLADSERVVIEVFNIRGQRVTTLINDYLPGGDHYIIWNGKDDRNREVGSGVYFYRMRTERFEAVRKMTVMR